jgi:ABC-type dipeptide/oligopeptide/nickel transport system ATPase component
LPPGCPFAPRCPWAFEKCVAERPPLRAVAANRLSACWVDNPGGEAKKHPGLWEASS